MGLERKRRLALFTTGALILLTLGAGRADAGPSKRDAGVGTTTVSVLSDDGGIRATDAAAQASATASRPAHGTGTPSPVIAGPADLVHPIPAGGGPTTQATPCCGPDKRTQTGNTTLYPARATVHITFQKSTGGPTFLCTGFLIGPHSVATAGHCVHAGSGGLAGFFPRTSFRLYPGRNGSTIPYTCPGGVVVRAQALHSNTSWANGSGEKFDYGAITTSCDIGNTTGWYGFINTQGVSQKGLEDFTRGYPGDKPLGTQWAANNCSAGATFAQCTIFTTGNLQLFYKNDTAGGQSGSPVYRKAANCNPCAIAIHAYGPHDLSPHADNNHGTRIENNVAAFLNTVRA